MEPAETSFWYLAERPGERFLREVRDGLHGMEIVEEGIWKAQFLGYGVFIVRNCDVAVTVDSLPLHVLGERSVEVAHSIGVVVASKEKLVHQYGPWLSMFNDPLYQEICAMVRAGHDELPKLIYEKIIERIGLEELLRQIGTERLVQQIGTERLVQQIGAERLVQEIGTERLLSSLDVTKLSADGRADLMRRLQAAEEPSAAEPQKRRSRKGRS